MFLQSGFSINVRNGSLLVMKNSFRIHWSFWNFTWCLLPKRGKHPNNKNIGSPGFFSRSLLTTAHLCAQVRARLRAHLPLVFEFLLRHKCFASLHFTDTAVDLVFNCAVGLNLTDLFTTFRLIRHVLSTNRSCQTKGPFEMDYIVSLNRVSHRPRGNNLWDWKLTYVWMFISEHF